MVDLIDGVDNMVPGAEVETSTVLFAGEACFYDPLNYSLSFKLDERVAVPYICGILFMWFLFFLG